MDSFMLDKNPWKSEIQIFLKNKETSPDGLHTDSQELILCLLQKPRAVDVLCLGRSNGPSKR